MRQPLPFVDKAFLIRAMQHSEFVENPHGRSPRMTASAKPPASVVDNTPATLAALEPVVNDTRAKFPLNIPADTAATFAASGYTMTRAKAELFRMITGDGASVASMQRELARAGFEPRPDAGPAPVNARANMLAQLDRAGLSPKPSSGPIGDHLLSGRTTTKGGA